MVDVLILTNGEMGSTQAQVHRYLRSVLVLAELHHRLFVPLFAPNMAALSGPAIGARTSRQEDFGHTAPRAMAQHKIKIKNLFS
jgi:hypothetical protein